MLKYPRKTAVAIASANARSLLDREMFTTIPYSISKDTWANPAGESPEVTH